MKARPFSLVSHFDLAWLVILFVVVVLPILVVPIAADSFVLPKELLATGGLIAGIVATLVWLLLGNGRLALRLDPLNAAVLLFCGWTWVSVLWAIAPSLAIESAVRTTVYTGWFFLLQLVVGGYRSRVMWLLGAVAASSLILSIWTLIQDFRSAFFPGSMAVRAVLGDWRDALSQVGLGNTSHLGDALVVGFLCWVGLFILARHRLSRTVSGVALVLHAAALIVTWSVHSNVSLVVAASIFVYTLWRIDLIQRSFRRVRLWLAGVVTGWVLMTAFFVVDHPLNPHGSGVWARDTTQSGGIFAQAFSSPRWTSGLDTRKVIWFTTLEIIREHPWLGTGAGSFTWVYPATISPIVQNSETLAPYSGSWTNAAHQEILQTWAELGIIGLSLLIVMIALSIRLSWQRLRSGASGGTAVALAVGLACLVALCLMAQMNFPLRLPVGTMHLMIFLAIPLLLPRSEGERWDLDVPVERPYGPINIGIMVRNMAYPTEISLRIEFPRGIAMGVVGGVVLLGGLWLVPASAPVRADLAYRAVRQGKLRQDGGLANADLIIRQADKVLAIWPGHVDCRSARQDLLLQLGRYTEVIEETPAVLSRLNATEVYFRRAMALEALGRQGDADPDWREIFRRRPEVVRQFPDAARRVLPTGQPSATPR